MLIAVNFWLIVTRFQIKMMITKGTLLFLIVVSLINCGQSKLKNEPELDDDYSPYEASKDDNNRDRYRGKSEPEPEVNMFAMMGTVITKLMTVINKMEDFFVQNIIGYLLPAIGIRLDRRLVVKYFREGRKQFFKSLKQLSIFQEFSWIFDMISSD